MCYQVVETNAQRAHWCPAESSGNATIVCLMDHFLLTCGGVQGGAVAI